MKYTYAYKTSDGTRHEASIDVGSREQVFAALRSKGIRAIKVFAADGSRANGEVRGVRRRMVVLSVLAAAIVAGLGVHLAMRRIAESDVRWHEARPLPRQEIPGDRRRVEAAAVAFDGRAEAFLARFAEPGRPFAAPEAEWPSPAEFESALGRRLAYRDEDSTEQIDLKRIIEWLKDEMRAYLRGGGDAAGYVRCLIRRQEIERGERETCERRLQELIELGDDRKAHDYFLKANARLGEMGVYPIPLPDRLFHYSLTSRYE